MSSQSKETPQAKATTPLSSYQKKLFVFLSVATFFEGYDFFAITQILPELAKSMKLSEAQQGLLVGFTAGGTVAAFAVVRLADRWGRKTLLTLTIAGYTTFTFLTGLSPNIWAFAGFQFLAKMFLIAEWATSMMYAAEEFPAERRGMVIGVIQAFSSLGSIACVVVAPTLLDTYGWRSVYFVGIIPLVILAVARRGLKESTRFTNDVGQAGAVAKQSLLHIWKTPHVRRMLQLALIWALTYTCTHNAVTFWKTFVVKERGFTAGDAGLAIAIAAVGSMPMVFYAGKLIDQIGRKLGAVIVFSLASVGVVGCYTLRGFAPLTGALVLGIFGASAVLPVLNAYNAELFPTELRGSAFAWSNNLLGRIGYVLSPILIGWGAGKLGWGNAVMLTAIGPVLALILILLWLPETKSRELEDTAAV